MSPPSVNVKIPPIDLSRINSRLDTVFDAVEKKTGMNKYSLMGMIGNMALESGLEKKFSKIGKAYSAFNDLNMLADGYDIDDSSKIPTRDYVDEQTIGAYKAYELGSQNLKDGLFKSSPNWDGSTITPEVRKSQLYQDTVNEYPYNNMAKFYQIKQFKDKDLGLDECLYINNDNFRQPISESNPLLPNQFKLNTASCPQDYIDAYNNAYIQSHPDSMIIDCNPYPDYLDVAKLQADDPELVFVENQSSPLTTSSKCTFEMVDKYGRLDLSGDYALITRPASYQLKIGNMSNVQYSNKPYKINPISNTSIQPFYTTSFSEPLVNTGEIVKDVFVYAGQPYQQTSITLTSGNSYSPTYHVLQFGNSNNYGLVEPSEYPTIHIAVKVLKNGNDTLVDGYARDYIYKKTGDVLQYRPYVFDENGRLDLGGTYTLQGSTNTMIVPKRGTSVNGGALVVYMDGADGIFNAQQHQYIIKTGIAFGLVDVSPKPMIRMVSNFTTDAKGNKVPTFTGQTYIMKGKGDVYKYRYKYVDLPVNKGKECDPLWDIQGNLLTERVPCETSDVTYPVTCQLNPKWTEWSKCATGGDSCDKKMPTTIQEWDTYTAYMCHLHDAMGIYHQYRKTTVDKGAKNNGTCDSFQMRNSFDTLSGCTPPIDCKYTEYGDWSDCKKFTQDTAKLYGVDNTKWYKVAQRKVDVWNENGGTACNTNVSNLMKFEECAPIACTYDETKWIASECTKNAAGKYVKYKYHPKKDPAKYGGACPEPTRVEETCNISECSFKDWSAWSSCVVDTNYPSKADKCIGRDCNVEGQVCYPGTEGSSGKTWICQNKTWVETTTVPKRYVQTRTRQLQNQPNNALCLANVKETQVCPPVDCVVEYGAASACMRDLDGVMRKTRLGKVTTQPKNGGKGCPALTKKEPC